MYRKTVQVLTFLLAFAFCAHGAQYGRVTASKLNIYEKAGDKSEITGLLGRNTRVEILEKRAGWAKIRLSDGTGYVKLSGLENTDKKPDKAPDRRPEPETKKDGPADDIKEMLAKFNSVVGKSEYADERKIIPYITVSSVKSDSEITLLYSAVNPDGKKIPSLLDNPLAKNMRELIELSFLKMIKKPAEQYKITVETPYFGEGGVVNGTETYAVFTLKIKKEQINGVEEGNISLWSLVRGTKKLAEVFAEYPR